jgi:hypothetical protein
VLTVIIYIVIITSHKGMSTLKTEQKKQHIAVQSKTDNLRRDRHLRDIDSTGWDFPLARQHESIITITYLLAPWSSLLLEKLTGSQLVKEFPSFYGTRRFITTFTSARHLPLS